MLKFQDKLKKIALILLLSSLLIGCRTNATSCEVFPVIPQLTDEEKIRIEQANMPDKWIKAIGDYREIRKKVCK